MTGYRILRLVIRTATAVFFRRIEVVGLENVPEGGPVVFAGNHPNALMDPAVLVASTRRIVRFAAKDTLFRVPLLRFVLRRMGAVPVARRSDHPDGAIDNRRAFESLHEVLVSGGAIGIFPEGLSHDASQVQRLKTGAARIAFGAAARLRRGCVRIIPCGLHYVHRKRFRSRVLVQFGTPVPVDEARLASFRADEREAVRALTESIEAGLRALTVNADDWETVRVLDGARRLVQSPGLELERRVELAREFNRLYPVVRDDPEVASVYERVRSYLDRLDRAGLADRDLDRTMGPWERAGRIARHLLLMLVWVPLAIPGLFLHAPIGLLTVSSARLVTSRKDVVGTTKLVTGILGCLVAYLALVAGVGWAFGWPWALGALAVLPITGYADVVVLDRGASIRRHLVTLARIAALGAEVESLRDERERLASEVIAVVTRVRRRT